MNQPALIRIWSRIHTSTTPYQIQPHPVLQSIANKLYLIRASTVYLLPWQQSEKHILPSCERCDEYVKHFSEREQQRFTKWIFSLIICYIWNQKVYWKFPFRNNFFSPISFSELANQTVVIMWHNCKEFFPLFNTIW